jgi:hypothetical protein
VSIELASVTVVEYMHDAVLRQERYEANTAYESWIASGYWLGNREYSVSIPPSKPVELELTPKLLDRSLS